MFIFCKEKDGGIVNDLDMQVVIKKSKWVKKIQAAAYNGARTVDGFMCTLYESPYMYKYPKKMYFMYEIIDFFTDFD